MEIIIFTSVLLVIILAFLAISYKYHIDTKSTIDELREERDRYRRLLWLEHEGRRSFTEKMTNPAVEKNNLYLKLKENISKLAKDIRETETTDSEFLNDVISALEDIDNYGEPRND
jgi:hypothetical protein